MNAPVATAIVVTHNSQAYIAASLTSLCQAELAVRVVDNASVDRTLDIIDREFPDVTVVANPVNVGFAAAVNHAVSSVETDIVLLVDPDCVVPPATAHELVRLLRGRPSVGIAGPRLIGPDGRVAISAHPFESLGSGLAWRFCGSLLPLALRRLLCGARRRRAYDACRKPGGPVEVDWMSGACLAVRTDLLVRLGGLDERYFLYYEDEELCLRARAEGAKAAYLPTVEAYHVGGASSPDPVRSWPHLYRSMLVFFARHRAEQLPMVRAAVLVRALIGIVLAGTRLPLAPRSGAARLRAWSEIAGIAFAARTGAPFASLCRYPERTAAAPADQKDLSHPSGGGSSSQRPDPARATPAN
ncbi:glycosyltransferase family 2 protein [Rugosimonospora africana]|uniref:Glycosyl transferase n=1 Tax=Rugosimonospora africana TaxID=556532 RepID=A0A8J3QTN2_9ACTN|nr:glycosyltransferase family 2 protein [Rugosimonospora africana]GIH16319.1 glycosyl transferase [Rugosimonospora africana]